MAKGAKAEYNFMRIEKKYLLTDAEYRLFKGALKDRLEPDKYAKYSLRNIYYDTEDDFLIRSSIENPSYKEKLRVRSYGSVRDDDTVFIEIKKKVGKTVGKRRIALTYRDAMDYLDRGILPDEKKRIFYEIDYLVSTRKPVAKQYVCYDREAYTYASCKDIRITFDTNITGRREDLTLCGENCGELLLKKGVHLLEIKVPGAIPVEISSVLSQLKIYPVSFSKYGGFYKKFVFENSSVGGIVADKTGVVASVITDLTEPVFSFVPELQSEYLHFERKLCNV